MKGGSGEGRGWRFFHRKTIINYTLIGFLFVTEVIGAASAAGLLEQTLIKSKTGQISLVMHRYTPTRYTNEPSEDVWVDDFQVIVVIPSGSCPCDAGVSFFLFF